MDNINLSLVGVQRGWTWLVDERAGEIGAYKRPHQEIHLYDVSSEPFLLRDFAALGKLEIEAASPPGTLALADPLPVITRDEIQRFFNRYGSLLRPDIERVAVSLTAVREVSIKFAAAWEVWKALSVGNLELVPTRVLELEDEFEAFGEVLPRSLRQLPLPPEGRARMVALLQYWLADHVEDLWRYTRPSAPIFVIEDMSIKPSFRHHSLLGFTLQEFVNLVTDGVSIKVCGSPKCGQDFIPRRPDQGYCGHSCREAHRQQRYRDRQKDGALVGTAPE